MRSSSDPASGSKSCWRCSTRRRRMSPTKTSKNENSCWTHSPTVPEIEVQSFEKGDPDANLVRDGYARHPPGEAGAAEPALASWRRGDPARCGLARPDGAGQGGQLTQGRAGGGVRV